MGQRIDQSFPDCKLRIFGDVRSSHALKLSSQARVASDKFGHFIDCIQNDKTPLVTGKEGLEALKVALEISQQIWKNKNLTSSS